MRSTLIALTLLAATLAPVRDARAAGVGFVVDVARSRAEFSVSHFIFSHVSGTIPIRSVTIVGPPTGATPELIEGELDPAGIDTRVADRDRDLRSGHFFDVERFPTIAFKSTRILSKEADALTIEGTLAMHGVERPIVLDVHVEGTQATADAAERIVYRATTRVRRSDFGMTYGGLIVGNDVSIVLTVEATRAR